MKFVAEHAAIYHPALNGEISIGEAVRRSKALLAR